MAATDQGPVFRQAIAERIEHETDEGVVFDCGFGLIPAEHGAGLVLGYVVVFKTASPRAGRPVLVHEARMTGHTPTDADVDLLVATAVASLQEQAARDLGMP